MPRRSYLTNCDVCIACDRRARTTKVEETPRTVPLWERGQKPEGVLRAMTCRFWDNTGTGARTWYHAGSPGLQPGTVLRPSSSSGFIGWKYHHASRLHPRNDWVYITPSLWVACHYATRPESDWQDPPRKDWVPPPWTTRGIYIVEPLGKLQVDEEDPVGRQFMAEKARIIEVFPYDFSYLERCLLAVKGDKA
jgi:hypothetical protein